MTFSHIILKNLKHNITKFTSYIFVNVFVISMLFTYGSIIFNPKINEDPILSSVMDFVYIGVISILLFSIIFISYTGVYFIKTRGKELGVYLTLGMTKLNLTKMILLENTVIMLISVIIGMISGLLFSGIFYLILGNVLEMDDLFYLDKYSFLLGLGVFLIVFICNIIYSVIFIKKTNIRSITIADKTKGMKKPSTILGALGVILFTVSTIIIYLIFTDNDLVSELNEYTTEAIFISIFVQFSSLYLVLASGLDFIVNLISKNKKYYNRNILLLSNLKYSFTTYKTTLFLITLLMGMSILFMGIQVSFKVGGTKIMNTVLPYDYMIESTSEYNNISKDQINQMVEASGGEITDYVTYDFASSQIYRNQPNWFYYYGMTTMIISESEFNRAFKEDIDVKPEELLIVGNDDLNFDQIDINFDTYLTTQNYSEGLNTATTIRSSDPSLDEFLQTAKDNDIQVFEFSKENTSAMFYDFIDSYGEIEFQTVNASIIDDSVYDQIKNPEISTIQLFNVTGVDQQTFCTSLKDELKVINNAPDSWQLSMPERVEHDTVEAYQPICKDLKVEETDKAMAMFSFTMTFISILFLIASSVVLYYKLVNDIDYEREQIKLFKKIGVNDNECKKYIKSHTGFIFFTPLVLGGGIGLLYTYAFFHNLPEQVVRELTLIVLVMYVVFIIYDILFYLFIRSTLIKKIIK
ncbi:ABC transporter permease [Mollicutes bacterium LVI A0078]|nr:ABC transporter permease [Mollicutes bacterium LVI A0075]WOO91410.1 ABC transporter permease [Mollicutes bacterium LVI A0078]